MIKEVSRLLSLVTGVFLCLSLTDCASAEKPALEDVKVVLKTSKGDIKVQLYASKTPVTVANFLNLAKHGFYDNVRFHRVIPNFMIQGGDSTGTGMGIPGYSIKDEFVPGLKHDKPGILSMANVGKPDTNGCQFFITHRATPHLDGKHTVFGMVLEGQNVVNSITNKDKILKVEFLDSPDAVLKAEAKDVSEWNKILQKNNYKAVFPPEVANSSRTLQLDRY